MTKEITKAFILQQMQDKFKLRELDPEIFRFSEEVVPVYNIEQHLEAWKARYTEISITGTGATHIINVPDYERWSLWRYDVVFMGAGAYTVAGIYTRRAADTITSFCYLDLGVAKSASYHIELSQPVVLQPGDRLYVNVDGYTSPQNLRLYYDYKIEEIR